VFENVGFWLKKLYMRHPLRVA